MILSFCVVICICLIDYYSGSEIGVSKQCVLIKKDATNPQSSRDASIQLYKGAFRFLLLTKKIAK
jgi:hypothetical protein